jgi:uncharacterized membrane protein
MNFDKPHITAQIAGRALHPLLRPFAIGYFLAVCFCDLVYSQASVLVQYGAGELAGITEWLLGVGLVMMAATAVVALIDYLGDRNFRTLPDLGMYAVGSLLVGALGLYNLDLRWTSGTAAILPMGLTLSLASVLVLFVTPTRAWARVPSRPRRR